MFHISLNDQQWQLFVERYIPEGTDLLEYARDQRVDISDDEEKAMMNSVQNANQNEEEASAAAPKKPRRRSSGEQDESSGQSGIKIL